MERMAGYRMGRLRYGQKKIKQAICILDREEYRRKNLKIRKPKYIREIRFIRKLIRKLLKNITLLENQIKGGSEVGKDKGFNSQGRKNYSKERL